MKKRCCVAVVLVMVISLTMGVSWARDVRFGHVGPSFHGQHIGSVAFCDYVNEKTGGRYQLKSFPMGQLGPEMSLAEQVQSGTLEIASVSTAVLMNFVPQVGLIDLPFIFPDRETAYAVLGDKAFQDKLFSYFPAKGFEAIGYTENEFRDITNSKHPIEKPEDLKGLKMRVMKSPVYIDTFKQLGANPVGLPFPEIYSALQQGVIDGQANPLYTSILIKVPEVNKFATRSQHSITECIIIVNSDFWASLSAEDQQIFREAADVCIKVNREHTVEAMKKLPKIGKSVDDYLKEQKVAVVDLTPEQRAVFAEAVRPVWEKYREACGPELYDFFVKKIEEYSKK